MRWPTPSRPTELGGSQPRFWVVRLRRGGTADVDVVLEGDPRAFSRIFVVKRFRRNRDDGRFLTMFMEEARRVAHLYHPNIEAVCEAGEADGEPFIRMNFVPGQAFNVLTRGGKSAPLSFGARLRVLSEVLSALAYAHDAQTGDGKPRGLVHRAVSPQNVFVTYEDRNEGRVVLMDFGIAPAMGSAIRTDPGTIKSKVAYMAPEQARNEELDGRADLYSVGVMLWEAATKRRLWESAADSDGILLKLFTGEGVALGELDALPVSPLAKEILRRSLATKREDRYPNAANMRDDIERLLEEVPEAPSLREISLGIARDFAEHREHMRASIERAIAGLP